MSVIVLPPFPGPGLDGLQYADGTRHVSTSFYYFSARVPTGVLTRVLPNKSP